MFSFIKKEKTTEEREEKERRKREKRERKEKKHSLHLENGSKLSQDELHRLDDIRRSLKSTLKKERLPSGIVADYRDVAGGEAGASSGGIAHSESGSSTNSNWSTLSSQGAAQGACASGFPI